MKRTTERLHLRHIWQEYVKMLLAANPDWSTGCNSNATRGARSNFRVYRPYDQFDQKLRFKKVEVINYEQFVQIVTDYFERARKAVVQGEVVNLGHRLGKLCMTRVERNFSLKTVDFAETKKQPLVVDPVTGKTKRARVIYLIDKEWYKVNWIKFRSIPNEVFYEFAPTRNTKSGEDFVTERKRALLKDPKLKYKYLYMPVLKHSSDAV